MKYRAEFEKKFQCKIAPIGSLLSHNLQTILKYVRGKELRNVLLYIHMGELPEIETNFEVVDLKYKPTDGNFIALGEPVA
ncbi:MAG: hypothetical protein JSW00_09690 [Thermoplasmata archaeon]|nr:MAG: hypothetical protein JSW00_09690 [Thermoplasmata archaeon]